MGTQTHRSSPDVLNRRTLQCDHRVLADLLRPGMAVLDIGCGTGAITAGIAKAVGPEGWVVGVDRDAPLLDMARREHAAITNLVFEQQDVLELSYDACFDIATAARALQWMANPVLALERMIAAVKPGGMVVVLDYNHERNAWTPDPPAEFARFYRAFLDWRAANGWNNAIADQLPDLFCRAGLADIRTFDSDEVAGRGSAAAAICTHLIEGVGRQVVAAGFLGEDQRVDAGERFREYVESRLDEQTLSMRTVTGVRRAPDSSATQS